MAVDAEKGEQRKLLQNSADEIPSWPLVQPNPGYNNKYFCCPGALCYPCAAIVVFAVAVLAFTFLSVGFFLAALVCLIPMSCFVMYTCMWQLYPTYWTWDLYVHMVYLSHIVLHWNAPIPEANEKFMPLDLMRPKEPLKKVYLDYTLNLQVPLGDTDQFLRPYLRPKWSQNFIEHNLSLWPAFDRIDEFAPEENCVEYVMKQLQAVYPPVYQEWADKHSDRALGRFCLYGLAAHRIETEVVDGRKLYVVRTNALSGLPVREGFERYGGDAYFDELWKPVMIVDYGMGPMREDDDATKVVTKPGDQNWARAKFRFRSSLFVLVTLVDHLYHVHLQTTNLFVTALREQMSPEHPIRRFLTPFTYQTISINDNAKFNLVAPRSMGPRCFALTERGLELAFTAAPDLVVPPTKDIFDLRAYILNLKESGVDTVYWRQALELYDIMERFVVSYLWCYYATKQDLADDPELRRFARHFFHCMEVIDAGSSRRVGAPRIACVSPAASAEDTWDFYVKWMAGVMWLATAGHEQMGAVEVYAQDASWTAFKWSPGALRGTKQTATLQALLMSFTSTPMPKLLGEDWSHLFPPASIASGGNAKDCFKKFQSDLETMAAKCDAYNAVSTDFHPANWMDMVKRILEEADSLPGLPGLHCSLMLESQVFRNLLAMATMRRWFCKSWILWTALILASDAALRKPSVAGKSIYFIVTDRFARSGPDKDNYEFCDLATLPNPLAPNGGAWCNGTLQGIIDRLDYIEGMGFDCIWITPVVKSLDYTGYYAQDFFDVDPHIGTKETLRALSTELHKRNMCLVVDIVANHVQPLVAKSDNSPDAIKTYLGVEGINPFNKEEYYHTYGKSPLTPFRDYVLGGPAQASDSQGSDKVLKDRVKKGLTRCGPRNMNLTECNCFPGNGGPDCPGDNPELQVQGWFGILPDLNQDNPFVRQKLLEYVQYLVREYDVDAFRLDTAIYMPKDFLKELQEAAGVDIYGETTVNNISYHAGFQDVLTGLLNFPAFYQVHASFCQYHLGGDLGNYHLQGAFTPQLPDLRKLYDILEHQSTPGLYKDLDLLGNFADNHDEFARVTYYCDHDSFRIRNVLAYVFLARGTPIIYYGTEQSLTGHQANVLERVALEKDGRMNKGQAYVRESMWQTRYNTSTWQYEYIKQLNDLRKKYGFSDGEQELVSVWYNHLILKRWPTNGGKHPVWIFLNNNQNWTADSPVLYCPAPWEEESWYDAFTGLRAFLREGCYMAEDSRPKLLVRGERGPFVKGVETLSEPKHVWMLWIVIVLLCLTNGLLFWRCRRNAKVRNGDDYESYDESDEENLCWKDIPNRLKSKFFLFNMVLPSTVSADNIYGSILRARFNAKQGTSAGILSLTRNVTAATISVWTKVQKVLLPTPSRFHYIFNLRELSRVFQGILETPQTVIVDEEKFVSLWRHECTRVFADKLSREKDKAQVDKIVHEFAAEHFGESLASSTAPTQWWCDFQRDKPPATEDDEDPVAPKVYEPVQSFSHVSRKAYEYLARFNEKNPAKAGAFPEKTVRAF
ncbi:SWA2, partial [Symbiodinium sp. KB8]